MMNDRIKIYLLIILAILTGHIAHPYAQNQNTRFEHIDIEKGLSQNMIRDVFQDNEGFMWIATWDGLNRYDGYEFKVYKHIDGDSTSLRVNKISCLLEDHKGRIWVGTFGGGLSLFNRRTETFTNYVHNPNDSSSICGDYILSLMEDSKNRMWIGIRSGSLSLIENNTNSDSTGDVKFVNFRNDPHNPRSISGDGVMRMLEDKAGSIWFGANNGSLNKLIPTSKGYEFASFQPKKELAGKRYIDFIIEDKLHPELLWVADYYKGIIWFDTRTDKFLFEYPYANLAKKIPIEDVQSILNDRNGQYWFGTYGDGIYTYKPGMNQNEQDSFEHFQLESSDPLGIDAPNITYLFEDKSGLIWIGTNTNGLYTHNVNTKSFLSFHKNPFDKNSLIDDFVLSVLEDRDGKVWIGTELGLDKYDPAAKRYTHYESTQDERGTSSNIVYSLLQDNAGIIWIGTSKGLDKYDPATNSFSHFYHIPDDSNSLSEGEIIELFSDSKGSLWIGSWNGGLNKAVFSPQDLTVKFLHYRADKTDPSSISDNRIMSIAEDKDGRLWIGTSDGGLNQLISDYAFNEDGTVSRPKFRSFQYDPKDSTSLSGNDVRTIYTDNIGTLWLGTFGGGLDKFVPPGNAEEKARFIHYRQKDGLANDVVRGILADESGNLWIGTANGLSKFDPITGTFWNFDVTDGLQTQKFEDAQFRSKEDGRLYFGGVGGVVSFFPAEIKTNPYVPEIVITTARYYNKTSHSILEKKGISEKKRLIFSYQDNILNFEFAALNFFNSSKNNYAYKLEGYSNNWIQLGNKREVTFTNLDPGKYTLHVRGSNDAGVWNNTGMSLQIIITPPWWRTNWAFGAYALLFILGMFITDRVMRRRIIKKEREQANLREAKLVRTQAAELEMVDQLVRVINRAENLENLFNSLLKQTMNLIPQAEKAAVFLRDKKDGLFRVAYTAGYKVKDLEKIWFTSDELKSRYSENSDEAEKGIFILNNTENLPGDHKLAGFSRAKSMLVMAVDLDGITEAYVVYDSFADKNAFDHSAANLLNRFREHAVSAIAKAQAIKMLQEKNEEIVKTQEQLITQQKLASLGALTAGIAHEIKNPLNFVNNFSELSVELVDELKEIVAAHQDKFSAEDIENLEEILQSLSFNATKVGEHGRRADNIVRSMLEHSRGKSDEMREVNINAMLEEDINLAYHGMRAQDSSFNVTIEKQLDPSIDKMPVVPQDISRVFLNIISNGFYAANSRKKEQPSGFEPAIRICTENLENHVRIRIRDNGSGIPEAIRDKLFNPFFTTKPTGEGTGLGLSLSHDIVVKEHHGSIAVETEEGEFTEFIISLPKNGVQEKSPGSLG